MNTIWTWVAGKAWWLIVVVALFMVILGQRAQVSNAKAATARVQADWSAQKAVDAEARIMADRAREQRTAARQAAIDKESRHGQEQIAALEADLAGARVDGERLRSAIRATADRSRDVPGAAGAGQGEPGADPIGMFADLLDRADRRAEAVAGYADRLRIAGTVCERAWDIGLRPPGT